MDKSKKHVCRTQKHVVCIPSKFGNRHTNTMYIEFMNTYISKYKNTHNIDKHQTLGKETDASLKNWVYILFRKIGFGVSITKC